LTTKKPAGGSLDGLITLCVRHSKPMRSQDSRRALRAATGVPGLDERFAVVKGSRLRYFVGRGSGDPLLLLHGLGGAASNFRALAPLLARHHRLLVPDLPGHAGSAPLAAVPTLAPLADRVALVAEHEGMLPAVIVGHSLGGLVALRIARRRYEDVQGVVLAGSAGISSAGRRARKALAITSIVKPGRRLAPFRRTIASRSRLRRLVFAWGAADPDGFPADVAESFLVGPALHTDTVSVAAALVRDDVRAELDTVRCPCLLLWGAGDAQTRISDAFDYARRLDAPLRVLSDSGHLLVGERPEACAAAIAAFARKVSGQTGFGSSMNSQPTPNLSARCAASACTPSRSLA
jgi:pimeloyl-ACP methyl ester carboxylesterase